MKATIQIKSPQGSIVTISVEHDEPMSISAELDTVQEKAEQSERVIEAGRSLMDEIKSLNDDHNQSSQQEKPDSYSEDSIIVEADRITRDEKNKRICLWCNKVFESSKNEKYCSDNCRSEKTKADKAAWYQLKKHSQKHRNQQKKTEPGKHIVRLKRCLDCMLDFKPNSNRQMICDECKTKKAGKNA